MSGESKTVDVIFFNKQGGVVLIKATAEHFRTEPISFLLAIAEDEAKLRIQDETYYLYSTYIDEKGLRVPNTPFNPAFTLEHMNAGRDTIYICVSTKVPVEINEVYAGMESEYGIRRAVPLRM